MLIVRCVDWEVLEFRIYLLRPIEKVFNVDFLCVSSDFLPRGNGIVTRRPLVLQLIHSESGVYFARVAMQTNPIC